MDLHPKKNFRLSRTALLGFAFAATTAPVFAAGVTSEMIANDQNTPEDVLTVGMGLSGQRYSTLTKINSDNVVDLVPAWSFSFGGEKQRGQETQPLVYNGKIFVTGSYSRIWALDEKTGQKVWSYEHRLPDGIVPCCDVVNRGAALYDNLVIFGTLDAHLVALNQDTGKVVWNETIDDFKAGYSYTAAPLIVKGLLITGVSGGEFGAVGRVEARDAKTGKMVWMRPTVEGYMGFLNGKENGISGKLNATWPGDMWKTIKYNFGPRPAPVADASHVDAFNGVSTGRGHLTGTKQASKPQPMMTATR